MTAPITAPSLLNPNVMLTIEKWGVTLTKDPKGFHARLVFEGVREKEGYFFRIAHLMGPSHCDTLLGCANGIRICLAGKSAIGVVAIDEDSRDKEEFKAKYSKKTQTWLVSRDKIEALIKEIEAEVGKESPFNICGNKSVFAKPVEVIDIYHPLLAKIKKHDQKLFLCLYDSAQNLGLCTGMSRKEFDEAISEVAKKIVVPLCCLEPLILLNYLRYLRDLNYPNLIKLTSAFTKAQDMYQNSCFTWARGNLEKLGIELTDHMVERIVSVTALYVKYKPCEEVSGDLSLVVAEKHKNGEEKMPLNLCERFVTYDVRRDKRAEVWKMIQKNLFVEGINYGLSGSAVPSVFLLSIMKIHAFLMLRKPNPSRFLAASLGVGKYTQGT